MYSRLNKSYKINSLILKIFITNKSRLYIMYDYQTKYKFYLNRTICFYLELGL